MTVKEIYGKETGDVYPDNPIESYEWHIRYVKWLEGFVKETLKQINEADTQAKTSEDKGAFDDKIDEWHNSNSGLDLSSYLGLTTDQYALWLVNPELVEKHYK